MELSAQLRKAAGSTSLYSSGFPKAEPETRTWVQTFMTGDPRKQK